MRQSGEALALTVGTLLDHDQQLVPQLRGQLLAARMQRLWWRGASQLSASLFSGRQRLHLELRGGGCPRGQRPPRS